MSIAISRLSFSRPLAIAMTISIATIVSSQALCGSVYRAAATIGMVSNTTISRLSLPLAISSVSITSIAVASKALWASICVAGGISTIARVSSSKAGEGCYNLKKV